MRCSEAMLLGAMNTTQASGTCFTDDLRSACAVGAAALAVDRQTCLRTIQQRAPVQMAVDGICLTHWPYLFTSYVDAPCTCHAALPRVRLYDLIMHLNDCHAWTRPAIAEWVKSWEPVEAFDGSQVSLGLTDEPHDGAMKG